MRKGMISLLALVLLIPVLTLSPALAEQPSAGAVFTGMLDRIVFALPAGGMTLYEGEDPGFLEDVRQIYGRTPEGEFSLRTADISGWIEGMLAHYPNEDPYHVRANTLIQFAAQILSSYGAQPTDMKAHDGGEYVAARFRFTYPDSPDVPCEGAAWLNVKTGRAVALSGTSGAALSAAIGAMRFADAEEQAAWDAREPETVTFDGLAVTFPVPATVQRGDGTRVVACLTDRFEYLAVQVIENTTLTVPEDDAEATRLLVKTANRVIVPTLGDSVLSEPALTRPASGTAVLSFACSDPSFGEFATVYRCALCITPRNVYYVWSADTETGRAFLDSFVWTEAQEKP